MSKKMILPAGLALSLAAALLAGCPSESTEDTTTTTTTTESSPAGGMGTTTTTTDTTTTTTTTAYGVAPYGAASPAATKPQPGKHTMVTMETTKGAIVLELHDDDAPVTTKNFVDLVNKGFYNGLTFHRYVEGFVIQGGDPTGTGEGGPGHTINLEIGKWKHDKGTLAMARTQDPNSAGSQFYITLADTHQLDGQYATFGHVVKGMENVAKLRQGDKMTKVAVSK